MSRPRWMWIGIAAAVLAAAIAPRQGLAQFNLPQVQVMVDVTTTDGRDIAGMLRLDPVGIDIDLGHYLLNPEKIRSLEFSENDESPDPNTQFVPIPGSVVTTTKETISGRIRVPSAGWHIRTELGVLRIDPEKIRKIELNHPPE